MDFKKTLERLEVTYLQRTFLIGRIVHYLFSMSLIGQQRSHSDGDSDVFLAAYLGTASGNLRDQSQLHVYGAATASATVIVITIHIEV